jgi:hypothetical protein
MLKVCNGLDLRETTNTFSKFMKTRIYEDNIKITIKEKLCKKVPLFSRMTNGGFLILVQEERDYYLLH